MKYSAKLLIFFAVIILVAVCMFAVKSDGRHAESIYGGATLVAAAAEGETVI